MKVFPKGSIVRYMYNRLFIIEVLEHSENNYQFVGKVVSCANQSKIGIVCNDFISYNFELIESPTMEDETPKENIFKILHERYQAKRARLLRKDSYCEVRHNVWFNNLVEFNHQGKQ